MSANHWLFLALVACGTESAPAPSPVASNQAVAATPPAAAASSDLPDPVATFNGRSVSAAELDRKAAPGLIKARQDMFTARKQALDEIINTELIEAAAKEKNLSEEELVKVEVQDKATAPTDAEIEAFYNENVAMMRGAPLDQMKPRIAQHLQQMAGTEAMQTFIDGLRAKANVQSMLRPPRIEVTAGDGPRHGNADAPIEIIEFSDFECPYCTRAAETVKKVEEHYGDKVSVVYRHFPLPMHSNAARAAEASECARDQGKFWEYHDQLFANQRAMGEDDLNGYATTVGVDLEAFKTCMASGEKKARVDQDMEDGTAAGMSGTPGFYINGRMLSGAQPFEAFVEIIDEELATPAG